MIQKRRKGRRLVIELVVVLLMFLGFAVFYFTNWTGITGLAVLDSGAIFDQNGTIDLGTEVTSLKVSGSLSGTGAAKLYVDNTLVLDSGLLLSANETYAPFSDVCIDSCSDITGTELRAEIEGSMLVLVTGFNYTTLVDETFANVTLPEVNKTNVTQPPTATTPNITNITAPSNITNITLPNETVSIAPENLTIIRGPARHPTIALKNRLNRGIGHFKIINITNRTFDIELYSKPKRGGFGIATAAETSVVLYGVRDTSEITALMDSYAGEEPRNAEITTEVAALNNVTFDNATVTLVKSGKVNVIMKCSEFDFDLFSCNEWQKTDISFTDFGDYIEFTVTEFSGYGGAEIAIINVQSYPTVGGNWIVNFTTNGTANLTISAVNGTTWSNNNENEDLKFLELKCGNTIQTTQWINDEVFIEDYSCTETSSETSKVITSGDHHLMFVFGDDVDFAHNFAFNTTTEGDFFNGSFNNTFYNTTGGFVQLNITESFLSGNYTSPIFDAEQSANWTNITWVTSAVGELANDHVNETAFPSGNINMSGNVLLYHFNNDSTYENQTHIYDWSGPPWNNGTAAGNGVFPNLTDSKFGAGSFDFLGSDDSVNAGSDPSLDFTGNFTVSAWARFDAYTSFPMVLCKGTVNTEYLLFVSSGSQPWLWRVDGLNTVTGSPRKVGVWQHVVGRVNATHTALFVDGVQDGTPNTVTFPVTSSDTDLHIGSCGGTGFEWSGGIDEVAIFNRSLSLDEIRLLYKRGVTRLNLSIRSCNDANCDIETFVDVTNDTSKQTDLNTKWAITDNQYFQYRFEFNTTDVSYTPELYNVTVEFNYEIIVGDITKPNVTTLVPVRNTAININSAIEIGANVTDDGLLKNVTANVTLPNTTQILVHIGNATTYRDTFNASFTITDLTGLYTVTIYVNDSNNNLNNTETTNFTVKNLCDSGDFATTCTLNHTYTLAADDRFDIHNFVIGVNGSMINDTANEFVFNLSGNFTMRANSTINISGEACASGDCNPGGNLTIIADFAEISGQIFSRGGERTASATGYGGDGGVVNITANNITFTGNISLDGGNHLRSALEANSGAGGDGGTLILDINTSLVDLNGDINAVGGTADSNDCTVGSNGEGGDGGRIFFSHPNNLTVNGLINLSPSFIDRCEQAVFYKHNFTLGNLTIGPTGNMIAAGNYNISSNLTIDTGGSLGPASVRCHVYDARCVPAGNISITADHIEILGTLTTAGAVQGNPDAGAAAGHAGNINLTADSITLTGTITADGGDHTQGPFNNSVGNGGDAGAIHFDINTSVLTFGGTVTAKGGTGRSNGFACSGATISGQQGDGGRVSFVRSYNLSVTGLFDLAPGEVGGCEDGSWINHNFIFGNLSVADGGDVRISGLFNITNNVTVGTGSSLGPSLPACSNIANCTHGGNLTLIAKHLELAGTLTAAGADATNAVTPVQGGEGGIINITVQSINFTGSITVDGGNHPGNIFTGGGGHAGTIVLDVNVSVLELKGNIFGRGGTGDGDTCGSVYAGDGGTLQFARPYNVTLTGAINLQPGNTSRCDSGYFISSTYTLGNLSIASGSEMFVAGILNVTNKITVEGNATLGPQSADCSDNGGNCSKGGNLTIIANHLDLFGSLSAAGGNANTNGGNGGPGGVLNITVQSINFTGNITVDGGDSPLGSLLGSGRDGGTVILDVNTSVLELKGNIFGRGGTGDHDGCLSNTDNRGEAGSGGTIQFSHPYNVSLTGLIDLSMGDTAYCQRSKLEGFGYSTIELGNLSIAAGSSMFVAGILNVTNNITIEAGGTLGPRAPDCADSAANCSNGGDLTIYADNIDVFGVLTAAGGSPTIAYAHGGDGGVLNISVNSINLTGNITIDGGDHFGTTNFGIGGDGGTLILDINDSLVTLDGNIFAQGGTADSDTCTVPYSGFRGNGGTVVITGANITIASNIVSDRGEVGFCDDGLGGKVNITTTLLNVTNNISAIGNVSGTIQFNAEFLHINSTITAINSSPSPRGVNGSIITEFETFINISEATFTPFPRVARNNSFGRVRYIDVIGAYETIDYNTNISLAQNLITVDSSTSTPLNVSAQLLFYNLGFSAKRLQRNKEDCSTDICTFVTAGQDAEFIVAYFTTYNAIENSTPNVTVLLPVADTSINQSIAIEIAANVTDQPGVSNVSANITLPNKTQIFLALGNSSAEPFKFNSSFNITDLAGNYNITFRANDTLNNLNNSEKTNFTVNDTTVPAVTITSPANGSNISSGVRDFTATVLDNVPTDITVVFQFSNGSKPFNESATNNSGSWNVNFNTLRLAETFQNMTVLANDSASNKNYTEIVHFYVDYTAPNVTWLTPSNYSNFSLPDYNKTFNVSVNETNFVNLVLFSFDNATGTSFNLTAINASGYWARQYNVSSLSEGKHTVTAFANDSFGNTNHTEILQFTVDNTPPSVTISNPLNASNLSSGTQPFNATIADTNLTVETVLFSFDNATGIAFNTTATNKSGVWNVDMDLTRLIEGPHRITILANDTVGNFNRSEYIEFTVDKTAPGVTWVTPPDGSVFSSTSYNQTFNVSVGELNFVQSVLFSFDNATGDDFNITAINNSGHWARQYNISSLALGSHIVTAIVNDSAGNYNLTEIITFTIDNTPPNVTNLIPGNSSNLITLTAYEIGANVTDNLIVSNVTANITFPNGTIQKLFLGNGTNYKTKFNTSFTIPNLTGNYNITFIANDSSNNRNKTEISFFTVSRDIDGDGIPDAIDYILGALADVTISGIDNLNITINGSTNLSRAYNDSHEILFLDGNTLLMNFSHNLSVSTIDFRNLSMTVAANSIVVNLSGTLRNNETKELYLTDNAFASLCVKDQEITSVDAISVDCSGENEMDLVTCLGNAASVTIGNATCVDLGARIKVGNLSFTGVRGAAAAGGGTGDTGAPASAGGGGGGAAPRKVEYECSTFTDCAQNEYCSDHVCVEYQCTQDSDCTGDQSCWNNLCVKLFDVEILDIETFAQAGDNLGFTYLVKGVAEIKGDVIISYIFEKDGKREVFGSDTIYFGNFEEKIRDKQVLIPTLTSSGLYDFYVQIDFGAYTAGAHRKIEIAAAPLLQERVPAVLKEATSSIIVWVILLVLIGLVLGLYIVQRRQYIQLSQLFLKARYTSAKQSTNEHLTKLSAFVKSASQKITQQRLYSLRQKIQAYKFRNPLPQFPKIKLWRPKLVLPTFRSLKLSEPKLPAVQEPLIQSVKTTKNQFIIKKFLLKKPLEQKTEAPSTTDTIDHLIKHSLEKSLNRKRLKKLLIRHGFTKKQVNHYVKAFFRRNKKRLALLRRQKKLLKYEKHADKIEERLTRLHPKGHKYVTYNTLKERLKQKEQQKTQENKTKTQLQSTKLYNFILKAQQNGVKKTPLKNALIAKGWPRKVVELYVEYAYTNKNIKNNVAEYETSLKSIDQRLCNLNGTRVKINEEKPKKSRAQRRFFRT